MYFDWVVYLNVYFEWMWMCLSGWYVVCVYSFAWFAFNFFDQLCLPSQFGGCGIFLSFIDLCKSLCKNNLSIVAFIAELSLRTLYPMHIKLQKISNFQPENTWLSESATDLLLSFPEIYTTKKETVIIFK